MRNVISLVIIISILTGCSAAGVVYTNDPYKKVRNAEYLTSKHRTLPARRFLLEVMEEINISEEKDEKLIGYTYRALGFLLSSSVYQGYRKKKDKYITPIDGDTNKGLEFYDKASEIFVKNELYYDASNTAWMKHLAYNKLELSNQACIQLDKSIRYHRLGLESDKRNGKNVTYSDGYSSFDDQLGRQRKKLKCK